MIYAATGHRPDKLGGYGHETDRKLFGLSRAYLIEQRPDAVISGMALGWDTAWAHAAYELKIPLIAAVPFDGQHSRWPEDARRLYHALLGVAHTVHTVSPGPYALWKMQARNRWMVDQVSQGRGQLVTLWNGSDGGTANCIRYAREVGCGIDSLWGRWCALG